MRLLLHWLLQFWFFPVLFAAGPAILTEGSPAAPPVEGETIEGEIVEEPAAEGAEKEPQLGTDGKPVVAQAAPDLRTVSPEVKSHLKELAKTNPKLANAIQNAVYTSQTLLKEAPGGVKEIQALKAAIEEAGGLEEIKNLRATQQALVDEQEDLDRRAAAGDPSVLDTFAEVAGDGLNKLMPAALDRWAQQDPEGYSYNIGKVMVSAMQEAGVVASLNLAAKMINLGTPEAYKLATDAFNEVVAWANKIGEMAATAPKAPAIDPKIAEQQKAVNDEKAQVFNDRFGSVFGSWRNQEIRNQVQAIAPKDKKFSDYQMTALGNGVISEIQRILTQDSEYLKTLERLYNSGLANRSMDELLKFTKSRNQKLLPDAVRKVYKQLFSEGTLGTKKVAATTAKPGEKQPAGTVTPPVKGWVKVSQEKAPAPDEIDNVKTTFKMKFAKQAILKNGRKVFWGDKVPKE